MNESLDISALRIEADHKSRSGWRTRRSVAFVYDNKANPLNFSENVKKRQQNH